MKQQDQDYEAKFDERRRVQLEAENTSMMLIWGLWCAAAGIVVGWIARGM